MEVVYWFISVMCGAAIGISAGLCVRKLDIWALDVLAFCVVVRLSGAFKSNYYADALVTGLFFGYAHPTWLQQLGWLMRKVALTFGRKS